MFGTISDNKGIEAIAYKENDKWMAVCITAQAASQYGTKPFPIKWALPHHDGIKCRIK